MTLELVERGPPPDAALTGLTEPPQESEPAPRTTWSDDRIRRELTRFLAGRDRFPSQPEFRSAGETPLLRAVQLSGGARRWASEFGLPLALQGRKRRYTDQRIRDELVQFLAGRSTWPPKSELREYSPELYSAVQRYGGALRWARELGLEHRPYTRWSEERVRAELTAHLEGRDRWPTQRQFRRAGQHNLLKAIYAHGGSHRWAAEFGMTVRPTGREDVADD